MQRLCVCVGGVFFASCVESGKKQEQGQEASAGEATYAHFAERCASSQIGPPLLRRLTREELLNTVRSTFYELEDWDPSVLGEDGKTELGFDSDADQVVGSVGFVDQWLLAAEDAADLLVGEHFFSVVPCGDSLACAETLVPEYAESLARGPIPAEDIEEILVLWEEISAEAGVEAAWRAALMALLHHHDVVYRAELGEGGDERALTGRELADALAYTYTGHPPDAALLELAASGALADPYVRMRQAERLLATPAGQETLLRFVHQWLGLDRVETAPKEDEQFSAMGAQLAEEASRMAASVFFEDHGGPDELLTADYTFLTPELARLYGMDAPPEDWARVDLGEERLGVLSTGAILAGYSLSDMSSPTQRGLLVYQRLMCGDVGAPPPEIPAVDAEIERLMTTRQRWERTHTIDPMCATCHDSFDPMGFAFENFDEYGQHREAEHGLEVDASGALTLPARVPVEGLVELSYAISEEARMTDCVSGMLAYWSFGGAGGQNCLAETARDALVAGEISFAAYFIALAGAPHFERRIIQ